MINKETKCDKCIHFITAGVANTNPLSVKHVFKCELGLINCDYHFEPDTDEDEDLVLQKLSEIRELEAQIKEARRKIEVLSNEIADMVCEGWR